uniref:Uncharacterized protein n=1 Tax=Utricularia reniformis TaxID=192314 RepID=A0A1Y0B4F0_9LAMI|nr:hypothetical protein AEK19_MT2178 [Utricularia reniformis]ART32325.1 hypothetical protein AEK19_MT2178 [Utricularia reniformis]
MFKESFHSSHQSLLRDNLNGIKSLPLLFPPDKLPSYALMKRGYFNTSRLDRSKNKPICLERPIFLTRRSLVEEDTHTHGQRIGE